MTAYRQSAEPEPELAAFDAVGADPCPRCGEHDWHTAVSACCPRNGLPQTMYCYVETVHRHVICWRCDYQVITESRKAYLKRKHRQRVARRREWRQRIGRPIAEGASFAACAGCIAVTVYVNGFHPLGYASTIGVFVVVSCWIPNRSQSGQERRKWRLKAWTSSRSRSYAARSMNTSTR